MKQLKIKFINPRYHNAVVFLDGKQVKFSKVKDGVCEATVNVEKPRANLSVLTYNELISPLWWFFSLIFYLISVFGLFDPIKVKSAVTINYSSTIDLSEEQPFITIKTNRIKVGDSAITISGNAKNYDENNVFVLDKTLQKRIKILRVLKIFIFIVAVLLIILKIAKII